MLTAAYSSCKGWGGWGWGWPCFEPQLCDLNAAGEVARGWLPWIRKLSAVEVHGALLVACEAVRFAHHELVTKRDVMGMVFGAQPHLSLHKN